ncbi:UPF0481 protein At3g47200-like [Arachis ipaensis]|uniref:UPF0481 protein At3g47200-like n=1 Tax=Arachis ipaensis TaxID=130454 RepID=UPI0007AF56AB|nr:UPF0481 protein At3g47200-like [Arachis ipaensis]XP_029150045.1 UPF0481 protein At3g47200-like [Arachis hypogaea]
MENEDHVAIEFEAMLEKAQPLFSNKSCCIYKVPHDIRQTNEDAYTPMVVSVGPLHHQNPRVLNMESHKQVYCRHFIERSKASLTDLMSCVREFEPQIRVCYSEKIDLTVDEFVKLILVDCGFVIELFLRNYKWMTRDDVIFSKPWLKLRLTYDLLLLENQLPLFVFVKLYNLAFASPDGDDEFPSFMDLSCGYLTYFSTENININNVNDQIVHFTDLFRYFILQKRRPCERKHKDLVLGHSASELVEAGLKFQVVNKSSPIDILDLKFEHGVLTIPHIIVDDSTEVWLRNIVALEQCHYPHEHYIADYVNFLEQLVNSNRDADVLIKAGIIQSDVSGSDTSVAKLFRDVDKHIVVENYNVNYLQICDDLNAYYKHPCNTKMATLRRDYFPTPWKTAASIAGIILLLLSVIQTVCSILQVK